MVVAAMLLLMTLFERMCSEDDLVMFVMVIGTCLLVNDWAQL